MEIDALRAWLRLIRCPGLGARPIRQLVERHGSAEAAVAAGRGAWQSCGVEPVLHEAMTAVDEAILEHDLEWLAQPRRGLLPFNDPVFPERLREIASSPPALFWRGDLDLLGLPQLAIVGSRTATPQGLDTANNFAAELTRRGLVVTSGLALGVDGAAHRGALEADGHTIAVCATGLDRVYPGRHKPLAEEIERAGLLVSEFAPGTAPRPESFPRRNCVISGLSLGVLVVEAARGSGSLITARLAAEQGREVFAIPGSIHNVMARGCHQLIRSGAKLVESVDDVLEEIGPQVGQWLRAVDPPAQAASGAAQPHAALLALVGDQPMSVDELVEASGIAVGQLAPILLQLELDGLIGSVPGGGVMRRRPA